MKELNFIDRRDENLKKFMEIENDFAFHSVITTVLVFINKINKFY